jgi:RHS repeat-associated protein
VGRGIFCSWAAAARSTLAVAAATTATMGLSLLSAPEVAAAEREQAPPAAPAAEASDALTAPDVATARIIAKLYDHRVEVIGQRTETTSTWADPKGTLTSSIYSTPIWVREGGDGNQEADWAPVDLTLQRNTDGSITPKAHPNDLTIAGGGSASTPTLFTLTDGQGGGAVSFGWKGRLPQPTLDGPRATYVNVKPGIDLVIEATRTGAEQYLLVKDRPGRGGVPADIDLPLTVRAKGLALRAGADGVIEARDRVSGRVVATVPTAQMWDAEDDENRSHPVLDDASGVSQAPDAVQDVTVAPGQGRAWMTAAPGPNLSPTMTKPKGGPVPAPITSTSPTSTSSTSTSPTPAAPPATSAPTAAPTAAATTPAPGSPTASSTPSTPTPTPGSTLAPGSAPTSIPTATRVAAPAPAGTAVTPATDLHARADTQRAGTALAAATTAVSTALSSAPTPASPVMLAGAGTPTAASSPATGSPTTPAGSTAAASTSPAPLLTAQDPEAEADPIAAIPVPVDTEQDVISDEVVELTLSPDLSYLHDPDTTFPVVVDPAVQMWAQFDTFVQSGISSDQSNLNELRLGSYNGGANIARSFINWNFEGLRDTSIVSARLQLWNWYSYSCSPREWQVWATGPANSSTRWAAQPTWDWLGASSSDTRGYDTNCNDGFASADVTGMLQRFVNADVLQPTWGLRATNESDSAAWKKFNSLEVYDGGAPHIDVTFNQRPEVAAGLSISDAVAAANGGVRQVTSLTPELSFLPRDPDGGRVNAVFYVYEGDKLIFDQWVPVQSGSVARLRLPAGVLRENPAAPYTFRATTNDGLDWAPDGWNRIIPQIATGKATEIAGCSALQGGTLQTWDYYGGECQRFAMVGNGNGSYSFLTRNGIGNIDPDYCTMNPGTRLQGWFVLNTDCQQFYLDRVGGTGDGLYRLLPRLNTNLAVDVTDASTANGAAMRLWYANDGLAERYRIHEAPDPGYQPSKLFFTTDVKAPGVPFINDSADYPRSTWAKGAGLAGSFSFRPATADTDVVAYEWTLTGAPNQSGTVTANGTNTVTTSLTPNANGQQTLSVIARDGASNKSPPATYRLNVGRGGIEQRSPGQIVARRIKLTVTADPGYTKIQFLWRRDTRPAGDNTSTPIPLSHLQTGAGTAVSSSDGSTIAYSATTNGNVYSWDAGLTLGYTGGPVQVAAVLSNTAGSYTTPWVTYTVDANADGAASDDLGPGQLNLLTGDYAVSATDAEEPGLSVGRVASSRTPEAGYQQQRELLTTNQQNVGTDTTGFTGVRTTVSKDQEPAGHISPTAGAAATGNGALRLTPSPTTGTASSDTYAVLGSTTGLNGLTPGARYRASGWIYVPSATGLNSAGQRLSLAYRGADGVWSEVKSSPASFTDAWQQVRIEATLPTGITDVQVRLINGAATGSGKAVVFDDLSLRRLWAPFGPAWAGGTSAEDAGVDYSRITLPEPGLAQVETIGGGKLWFTKVTDNGVARWWPELGSEDLTLEQNGNVWTLRELDGTTSTFTQQQAGGDFLLQYAKPAADNGQAQVLYETVGGVTRPSRVVAPVQTGIDAAACAVATGVPARGCVVLQYDYATTTTAMGTAAAAPTSAATSWGDVAGQIRAVQLWTTNPVDFSVSATQVATYRYDAAGQLREVFDPRIDPTGAKLLKTSYEYDTAGHLTKISPPGELPWRMSYGTAGPTQPGSADLVDANPGRLLNLTRASLTPGTPNQPAADVTTSVVYNVPTLRGNGGPYDLAGTLATGTTVNKIADWGQSDGPTDATAVFGPEDPVTVNTATASTPGADGYRAATVHYLNAAGEEVNTATPAGPNAPAEGFIDTSQYDKYGNVVSSLEATNRLLALGVLTTAGDDLSRLGLSNLGTAARAGALSTLSTYALNGIDQVSEVGPVQMLVRANDTDTAAPYQRRVQSIYDENRPEGKDYHLLTTQVEDMAAYGTKLGLTTGIDPTVTVTRYAPLDGSDPRGPTSGWTIGAPTSITTDADKTADGLISIVTTATTPVTSSIVYDPQGRAIESRPDGAGSTSAATTKTVYWSAGTNAADASCGNRPEWAGLACLTKTGGDVTGITAGKMSTALPIKRVAGYSRFGSETEVTETATGPLAGATVTQTRTTKTTYDDADRVRSVEMTGTGTGMTGAAAVATSSTRYDEASGDVLEVSTTTGGVTTSVKKAYDLLGRMTRYQDATGAVQSTVFDKYGKPTQVSDDTLGTSTSFTYDRTKDPRGFLTSTTDSVAGTQNAVYGPDGQLLSQTLPGGVNLTIGYDPAGVATTRTYTRASDGGTISSSTITENGDGNWASHTTSASAKRYSYDRLGRLSAVRDTTTSTGVCTWRAYGWNTHAGRTSKTSTVSANTTCVDPAATDASTRATVTSSGYSYDSADRLAAVTGTGASSAWTYDPLGRITTAPIDAGSGSNASAAATVAQGYFVNDRIASQEVAGVAKQTWTLDPLQRPSTYTQQQWVNGAWAQAVTKTTHYDSDSDEPSWIAEDSTLPGEVTRYVDGMDGDLAISTSKAGTKVLQLTDLHGDVMATLPIRDGQTTAAFSELKLQASDEFGLDTNLSTGKARISTGAAPARDARYGWLGGKQRSADALAGMIVMGARMYAPTTGRFLSPDPSPGGNATAYDYCTGDPVNCSDLDGQWSLSKKWKKRLNAVARVASVASMIPGPVGAAASAVGAVAYAATGNKKQAAIMALGIAASAVGAGAAVKLGSRYGGRIASAVVKVGKRSRGCNSFAAGTTVLMADGTTAPIEDVHIGDLVWTTDPITGESSAQPVLNTITGTGDKHLIDIRVLGSAEPIVATANHPVWVEGRGWTNAEDLSVGDRMRGASGGLLVIAAMHDEGWLSSQTVYNLSVATTHTFFVLSGATDESVLTHNASSCSLPVAKGAWQHIMERHVNQTSQWAHKSVFDSKNKSKIYRMMKTTVRKGSKDADGNYTYNFGRKIGTYRGNSQTRMRVTVRGGKVRTAHPVD